MGIFAIAEWNNVIPRPHMNPNTNWCNHCATPNGSVWKISLAIQPLRVTGWISPSYNTYTLMISPGWLVLYHHIPPFLLDEKHVGNIPCWKPLLSWKSGWLTDFPMDNPIIPSKTWVENGICGSRSSATRLRSSDVKEGLKTLIVQSAKAPESF